MYLRKANGYIIGALMTGFHFTRTAVPVLTESRFPFHRIPGFLGPEYSIRSWPTPSVIALSMMPTPLSLAARSPCESGKTCRKPELDPTAHRALPRPEF